AFAVSLFAPATTCAIATGRRVTVTASPDGVGPRSMYDTRPSFGNASDSPLVTLTGREMISTLADLSPSAVALSITLPALVAARMATRLTPPSTGKLLARM